MDASISALRTLARVRARTDKGRRLHLEFRNGSFATVDSTDRLDFNTGSLVYVDLETNSLQSAPSGLWPEETWVGVVRKRTKNRTVVQSSGSIRILQTTSSVKYVVGNTVEVSDTRGITRVLDRNPIVYKADLDADTVDVSQYRPKLPKNLTFDDFGGSEELVARARELIEAPLKHHALLRAIKAKPVRGVLFAGASGTGKTMLARIIASESQAAFYLVNGPDITSKWYGDSQKILRAIFQRAIGEERAIIFFDEIDSIAGQRTDESHEESQRVVAQLLTQMDGFSAASNLIVIAATNRPEAIDRALLRPGRFDWQLNFPPPDKESRQAILRASAKRLSAQTDLPHAIVAERTDGWTGADLAAIFSEAALLAAQDGRPILLAEDYLAGLERAARSRTEKSVSNDQER